MSNLYECDTCGHMIASDAQRCPSCGAEDAGSITKQSFERQFDPKWIKIEAIRREKEEKERCKREKKSNKENDRIVLWWGFWILYPLYTMPTLLCLFIDVKTSADASTYIHSVVPILNWILLLNAAFSNTVDLSILEALKYLAFLGVALFLITEPK